MTWTPTSPESVSVPQPPASQDLNRLRLRYELMGEFDGTHRIEIIVEEGYDDSGFVLFRSRAGSPFTLSAADTTVMMGRSGNGVLSALLETELWTWLIDNGKIPAGAET